MVQTTDTSSTPFCYINGKRHTLPPGRAEATLLQFLRESGYTGTKLGCGEGGCGACTIMVSSWEDGAILHRAVNACLCPLYAIEGMAVVTVEGIGNPRDGLHPVQERLAKAHGSQCGFCTPGFVMSMYSLLRSKPEAPTEHEIEEALAGNLCRCTGYRPILDAFRVFAKAEGNAYTEEAISASQQANGHSNGVNGQSNGVNGLSNGHNGVAKASSSEMSSSDEPEGEIKAGNGLPLEVSGMAKDAPNAAKEQPVQQAHSSVGAKWEADAKARKPRNPPSRVCPSTGRPCDCGAAGDKGLGSGLAAGGEIATDSSSKLKAGGSAKHVHTSVEPIFPPELKSRALTELTIPGPLATWYRPTTLEGLLEIKSRHHEAKLVVGNTEVGIEMKFKSLAYPHLVGATAIPELNSIKVVEGGLQVGASVTLTRLMGALEGLVAEKPAAATRTFKAMWEQLKWFAGPPIRNSASVGGNIATGSPISDLNPIYMAAGATFLVAGKGTPPREINARDFFLGYRKVDMKPHEIIVQVVIPFTQKLEYVKEFKQAHRRDDDIAIVNAGMRFKVAQGTDGEWQISEAHLAFGGVAPKTVMAPKTKQILEGAPLTEATLDKALAALSEDIYITPDAPGGMVEFRRSLASSFLFRFFAEACYLLQSEDSSFRATEALPVEYESAVRSFERPPPKGIQYFTKVADGQVVGQPDRHMAADLQVSGIANYTDDTKLSPDFLHAALVVSTKPFAKILSVDPTEALEIEGVKGYFDHEDIPGENIWGAVIHDEEVFASDVVTCMGQQIGVVVAETEAAARLAAKAVKVEYEELPGAVFSCEEAIAAGSFIEGWGHEIVCGDVEAAFASGECNHILEGEVKMGGQEHFYLEPQGSVVIPLENDEMVVISSTQVAYPSSLNTQAGARGRNPRREVEGLAQGPMHNQMIVSEMLGIPAHKVVARTKRVGGGFGGKETRAIPLTGAACLPAWLLKRPVRLIQDRDEDMHTSGHRHAFLAKYKVGFTKEGKIIALDVNLYNNAGNSLDLSHSVMDRALLHSDNCYKIPHVRAIGHLCKTNTASNTAFRGFGGPQGMLAAEMWVERIARLLNKPPEVIREMNFLKEGETTHFGQVMECSQIETCWDLVYQRSDFAARKQAVEEFNAKSRFRKRGISLIPTKFGISFTAKFLNQAGALVHCYTDGSVLVSHGGVEMGQGLHTKVAQIAAGALGLPLSAVFIAETATDKVPNASSTAASASSDLYGAAVADACRQLNARLAPFKEKLPDATFREIVNAAYLERVDLSAHGFYKTPDVTGFGGTLPFNYFTFGASCSEVELDTLTGDFHLLRADLCMDVGQSLNPAIDIGQVEGGFVQGMGWTCIEELVWGDQQHTWVKPGVLHTRGPGTYKIPTANDIPIDLRVTLLRDAPCHRTPEVHSSKAVGEPPFFLGASVFLALKEAVYSARKDAGYDGWFRLDSPATPERLRMACADKITATFAPHDLLPKISC